MKMKLTEDELKNSIANLLEDEAPENEGINSFIKPDGIFTLAKDDTGKYVILMNVDTDNPKIVYKQS